MCTRSDESRLSKPAASDTSGRMLALNLPVHAVTGDQPLGVESVADAMCSVEGVAARQVVSLEKDSGAGMPDNTVDETKAAAGGASDDSSPRPFTWRELTGAVDPLQVSLRFGTTCLSTEALRGLRIGAVVRLEPTLKEPVEIFAGRQLLGYGHVVLVDGKLAVQVTVRRQPSRRQTA